MGVVLLVAAACSAPSVSTDPVPLTTSTLAQSAERVGTALSEVSLHLSSQMTGEEKDLIMAWTDFEGDVRSVVNDLIRTPSRVDVDGMKQRVEDLEELLHDSGLELPAAEWEEFTSAFQTLIEEATAAGDSAVIEHMFANIEVWKGN